MVDIEGKRMSLSKYLGVRKRVETFEREETSLLKRKGRKGVSLNDQLDGVEP